jgi:hypothetical protein
LGNAPDRRGVLRRDLVHLNVIASGLNVLLVDLENADATDVTDDRRMMRTPGHDFVGVPISRTVCKPDDSLGLGRHDPIAKLQNVAGDDLLDPHWRSPNIVVVATSCRRAARTRRSQRMIDKVPAFTSPHLLPHLAVRPRDHVLIFNVVSAIAPVVSQRLSIFIPVVQCSTSRCWACSAVEQGTSDSNLNIFRISGVDRSVPMQVHRRSTHSTPTFPSPGEVFPGAQTHSALKEQLADSTTPPGLPFGFKISRRWV